MTEYPTLLLDMPTHIHSYVIYYQDEYTVIINARLNDVQRLKAYMHELDHIESGDCQSTASADLIEVFVHKEDYYVERETAQRQD